MLISRRPSVLAAGETCLVAAAVATATWVRLGDLAWPLLAGPRGTLRVLLIVGVCQLSLHYADLYDFHTVVDVRDLMVRLLQAFGVASLILALLYFWFPGLIIGRGVFLITATFVVFLVFLWRLAFGWVVRRVGPRERLLLVGSSPASLRLAGEIHDRSQELGVEIIGFVDPDRSRIGERVLNPSIIGTIEDIPSLVQTRGADRVVVNLSDARGRLPMDRLLDIRLRSGVSFDHLASVYEQYTGKIPIENLRPSWLIFAHGFRKTRWLLLLKRLEDLVLSAAGLMVAAPLMLLIAVAVKLTSPGPVLYHQERVGLNGRTFTVHKFRTMKHGAEAETGPVWSRPHDSRVTRVGDVLRRTRIDELPQLWNVLRGDMSLVGPRPERPTFVEQLTRTIPFYGQRHVVKPGLTGWAQVRYTYAASVEDAAEKLQYDLYYVKHLSLALDVVILLDTIKTVVLGRGAR